MDFTLYTATRLQATRGTCTSTPQDRIPRCPGRRTDLARAQHRM